MQVSLQVSPNPGLGGFFTHLTPTILPVFWFEAEASITEEIAQKLNVLGEKASENFNLYNHSLQFSLQACCHTLQTSLE